MQGVPVPGFRNFLDLPSSGESCGLLLGKRKETIEFFLDPDLVLLRSAEVAGIHSLLLVGVIFTLEREIELNQHFRRGKFDTENC